MNLVNQKKVIFKIFLIMIIFLSANQSYSQTINEGIWYHQQPTSVNDTGQFYGGKKNFEGFCGPTAAGMALQYFIPNIHAILYNIYGSRSFHDDNRGGLTPSDPYCYNEHTTYPFEDFLGHYYIGRHITKTGCSYRELEAFLVKINQDIKNYVSQIQYISRSQLLEYLNEGYLVILNTNQGGGHYILIGGWDGNALNPDSVNFYIWDGWKIPLDIDSTQYVYTTDLAGNKPNPGSVKNILCYRLTSAGFNKIFKDQMGDGTMLAVKFMPKDLPHNVPYIKTKGIWVSESIINKEGISGFINNVSTHGITDLFLFGRGLDWFSSSKTLKNIITSAHQKNIKVHVSFSVLHDSLSFPIENSRWIDVRDTVYRNYFLNQVVTPLCSFDIDGIHMNCLRDFGDAPDSGKSSIALVEYYRLLRKTMDKNGKTFASLSTAIIPEINDTLSDHRQNYCAMTKYLNFVTPLLYTHKNFENPGWVGHQVNNILKSLESGCRIWTGLQSLDDNGNYTPSLELKQCTDYALSEGSYGIIYDRYPLISWQWKILDKYKKQ